ncbi:hypothetical protein CEXT_582831 [Caerostris extrusa]|uniref:Uncharacterized protein n=1 Tax=Caerostris extrusa TaxID=172846 RepID=A0AAV4N2R8_CAEEX|nr:hypothetical protein CEXT_582831 [Caerostris extrusa]
MAEILHTPPEPGSRRAEKLKEKREEPTKGFRPPRINGPRLVGVSKRVAVVRNGSGQEWLGQEWLGAEWLGMMAGALMARGYNGWA